MSLGEIIELTQIIEKAALERRPEVWREATRTAGLRGETGASALCSPELRPWLPYGTAESAQILQRVEQQELPGPVLLGTTDTSS